MELNICHTDAVFNRLAILYHDAFPPEERRPDNKMIPMRPEFGFYAVTDVGKTVGLLSMWQFNSFNYIEHFAIFPEMRNCGYGSRTLSLVPDPVILEVEPAEISHLAASRIEFYKRNGFRELDFDYVQPPYSPRLPEVRLRLMARGTLLVSPEEIAKTLHQEVYGQNP